jgi:hypothetical protein
VSGLLGGRGTYPGAGLLLMEIYQYMYPSDSAGKAYVMRNCGGEMFLAGSLKVYTSKRPAGRTRRKESCVRNVKSSIPELRVMEDCGEVSGARGWMKAFTY